MLNVKLDVGRPAVMMPTLLVILTVHISCKISGKLLVVLDDHRRVGKEFTSASSQHANAEPKQDDLYHEQAEAGARRANCLGDSPEGHACIKEAASSSTFGIFLPLVQALPEPRMLQKCPGALGT